MSFVRDTDVDARALTPEQAAYESSCSTRTIHNRRYLLRVECADGPELVGFDSYEGLFSTVHAVRVPFSRLRFVSSGGSSRASRMASAAASCMSGRK